MTINRLVTGGYVALKTKALSSTLGYILASLFASAGYFLGAKVGFAMTFGPHPISVMWPPNAILLAALLLMPVRAWWLVIIMALPAHLAVEAQSGVPLPMVLCWFVSNSFEALVGAAVTRFLIGKQRVRFDRLRDITIFFICGALLGAFLSSFLDAAFVVLNNWGDDGYWELWHMRFYSNVFASMIIVPAIVTWTAGNSDSLKVSPVRAVEIGCLMVGLLSISFIVFYWAETSAGMVPILLSVPLPFFLWATLRFGVRGTSATILMVAVLVIWSSVHSHGPFLTGSPEQNALSIQTFFVLLAVTLMPLAAVLKERKTVTEELRASEERYREVVESQSELVCRSFAETTLTFVNESFCQFFRRSREELLGRKLLDLVAPAIHERILRNYATVIVKRQPLICECEALVPNRGVGWQQWIIHPVVGADGQVREIQVIGRDVTERRRAEEALRESEERYREVVEAQTELVSRYLPDTTLTFVNEAFCRFLAQTRGQLIGRKLIDLLPPQAHGKILHGVASAVAGRQAIIWEDAFVEPNGTTRWQQWTNYPIMDGGTRVTEIQAVGRDITDRKRAEEAMRNLTHASRLAVIGELTAVIAHEVSQPLNAILNNVEAAQTLMKMERIPLEDIRAILSDIHADDLRAGEAVHRIRALAKKRELEVQSLSLNTLIEDVLRFVSGDAARRRVQIRTHLAKDLPLVLGDPIHVQQIILNLIINGMDAMAGVPEGERFLTIVTEKRNGNELLVAVEDTGHGIPPEMIGRVFESFFSTRQNGIGLGLSIARSIVETHRGRIWVENNPDRGATFRFTLPLDSSKKPESI